MSDAPDISAEIAAFDHQCECNLSYIGKDDRVVVEIGQGHLKGQFKVLAAERDALQSRVDELEVMVGFYGSERENGVATTFSGVPIGEAIRILLAYKAQLATARNDALEEAIKATRTVLKGTWELGAVITAIRALMTKELDTAPPV